MPSELVKCNKCGDYYDFRFDEHVCEGEEKKMSEWLSTGQMVDSLQVGQDAECSIGDIVVTKSETGQILVKSSCDMTYPLTLDFKTEKAKWRLIPNTISFWEAMHYVEKGEMVHFHPSENSRLNCHTDMKFRDSWFAGYTFGELIKGEWSRVSK